MARGKKADSRSIRKPSEETPPSAAGKSWFFGIGIDQYKHKEIPNLNNAADDIRAVLALLQEKYELDHPITLFNKEATRQHILWELEKLADNLAPADKLLIYFSGHGYLDKRGKGHWIPHDGSIDHTADFVPNVLIKDKIEDISSRHTLLIADACFSGSVLFSKRKKRVVTLPRELDNLKSRWVITSGRHYQLVDDGEPGRHSPFAASIIEFLQENRSYELTLTRFCEEIRERTNERAAKQSPVFGRLNLEDDEGGEYIFRLKQDEAQLWSEAWEAGTVLSLSRFLGDFPSGKFAEEARRLLVKWEEEDAYWEEVLKQNRISSYHSYQGKHPAGRYTSEAKKRISVLEEQIKAANALKAKTRKSEKEKPKSTRQSAQSLQKPSSQPQPPPTTFTDPRDGQTYRTVELNGLRWMAQNLNFDVGEGCWFYKNDPENGKKYGRLYTWEAAKKACPPGWRLPTDEEWKGLANANGGYYDWETSKDVGDPKKAYTALLEGGSSGFSALLGGFRGTSFSSLGGSGGYWSATEGDTGDAWRFTFGRIAGVLGRSDSPKGLGHSCRCVQGAPSNGND